jgi:hypothetical protein
MVEKMMLTNGMTIRSMLIRLNILFDGLLSSRNMPQVDSIRKRV